MHTAALVVFLAAVFCVPCRSDGERCVEHLQNIGAVKIDIDKPLSYYAAWIRCTENGLDFLVIYKQLNEEEKALCGDQLVPYAVPDRESSYPVNIEGYGCLGVNLTSGQTVTVSDDHEFSCILCQYNNVKFPLNTVKACKHHRGCTERGERDDDRSSSSYFRVELTQTEDYVRDYLTEDVSNEAILAEELNQYLEPVFPQTNYSKQWMDESQRLHVEFLVSSKILASITTGDAETSIFGDTFSMRVDDVGFCSEGETVDVDGTVTHWPKIYLSSGYYQYVTNASTGAITRRKCSFSNDIFHGEWLPKLSRWELVWKDCTSEEKFINEEHYIQFLNSSDIERRHANVLHYFTLAPGNATTLQEVTRLVDRNVRAQNKLSESIIGDLITITASLKLDSDFVVALEPRASLVVAELKNSMSAEGFTLDVQYYDSNQLDNITANRKPTIEGNAPFAFDVSARLLEAHTRVVFVIIWRNHFYEYLEDKLPSNQYLELTVIFPRQGEVSAWSFAMYGNHYVDITYDTSVMLFGFPGGPTFIFLNCVAWSNDLADWTNQGCKKLYTDVGNFSTCRCSGKYFVMKDSVPIARYALKKGFAMHNLDFNNDLFTDFFKDKPGLMVATTIFCLLSVFGLGSIIGTAIFFKQWRENMGHKILLQMILALTCNLVLGFVVTFKRMTTESIGCLVYGVLCHYSFLAMFLWMLVLSCLQLKRLTTVAGAKATSHLLLKVSLFAWGLPLVPIVILLGLNPSLYQTDRFDRGYCYPEGIVFQITVQGPAGAVLFVNFGIFVKIVIHIFDCCNKNKVTRHSKNERAEQLNKFKTSIFMFFLFGFSWVFHIFSEERVLVSDFLFEYLFLMTTTTHIFSLALFFVVFQESTRNNWDTLRRKAAIKKR